MVCQPKDQGGLGGLKLSVQNNCLLMKHIHKFYNQDNIPCIHLVWESYYHHALPPLRHRDISFWWRDCLKNLDLYKAKASCTLNSGMTVLFWTDLWNNEILSRKWPFVFTFVKDITICVKNVLTIVEIPSLFHLSLSTKAMNEYQQLLSLIQETQISLEKDKWSVTAAAPGYKVSYMYKDLMKQGPVLPVISWLWKICCQEKHKVFFCCFFHNRLNTRAMLQRKRFFLPDYTCIMRNGSALETRDQLFFSCSFAVSCSNTDRWAYGGSRCGSELRSQNSAAFFHGDYYADFLVNLDD
jgi:hypothetical protein